MYKATVFDSNNFGFQIYYHLSLKEVQKYCDKVANKVDVKYTIEEVKR